jgi:hypothetical protein
MALLFVLSLAIPADSVTIVRSSPAWSIDTCQRSVFVKETHLFLPGCRVLLHVPTCAAAVTGMHQPPGAWAWNVVDTVADGRLWLRYAIASSVSRSRHMQIVRAYEPANPQIDGRISAQPWNGSSGGIIAIWSDSAVEISGKITANGVGFRSGQRSWNSRDTSPPEISHEEHPRDFGHGEGACQQGSKAVNVHRWYQGGHAGSARNGGGGGGNATGAGGAGGMTSSAFGSPALGSAGQMRDASELANAVFGSAGGSGHGNDLDGGDGGPGGGLVFIACRQLQMQPGSIISADGVNGKDASHDGAGGGGAGGMIVIDADSIIGFGALSVRGGHGGSTHSTLFLCGPGGGGAGGSILLRSALPDGGHAHVEAGVPGEARLSTTPALASDHGARPGGDGSVIAALPPWKDRRPLRSMPRLSSADSVVERGRTTKLWVSNASVVRWLNDVKIISADSCQTPPIDSGHWFRALITTADGCMTIDSVHVRPKPTAPTLIVSIGDLKGRAGDSVDIYLNVRMTSPPSATVDGTAYVSTYARVLMPARDGGTIRQRRTHLMLPFRLSTSGGSTYRRDRLVAVLGDSATVQISIDSVVLSASSASVNVRRTHGSFTLEDLCREGGRPRLFDGESAVSIIGRTIRTDAREVYVSDALGRMLQQSSNPSRRMMDMRIDDSVRGLVFVVLSTDEWMRSIPVWLSGSD